ncbi:hypothetical protein OG474_44510 [Kribbella sp. NBC_01505]|uniref:hypothetical protein n=1 Tax=Kribbella sp. NBC_01505 TaxID=2903580 RepID=UPI00386CCBC6
MTRRVVWVLVLVVVVPVVVFGAAVAYARNENRQFADYCISKPDRSVLPFDGAGRIIPLNKKAPKYTGAGPHPVTFRKGHGWTVDYTSYTTLDRYALPAGWESETQPQLLVCEFLLTIGEANLDCGPYGRTAVALVLRTGRIRYEIREARTAKVVGSFELDSAPFNEKMCPGAIFYTSSSSPQGEVIPPAQKQFDAALKPYVAGEVQGR